MHYLTIPEDFDVKDTYGKIVGKGQWSQTIHLACAAATQLTNPGSTLSKYKAKSIRDCQTFLASRKAGQVVETPDEYWEPLNEVMRNPPPGIFPPIVALSQESHERAICDAPTEKPVEPKEANGLAKEQSASTS
jgi:hypothetical protein